MRLLATRSITATPAVIPQTAPVTQPQVPQVEPKPRTNPISIPDPGRPTVVPATRPSGPGCVIDNSPTSIPRMAGNGSVFPKDWSE